MVLTPPPPLFFIIIFLAQGGEGTQGRQQGRQGFRRRIEGEAHGFQAEGRQHHVRRAVRSARS